MAPLSWSTGRFTAHTMTATFPHSHLAAFLEHPNKTFFSAWLRNGTWSTKFTTTFTYPTRRNMTIFHPVLATAFWTGKNKHPQNVARIFYSKSSLFDKGITTQILGSLQHSPTQPATNVITFHPPHINDCIPHWKE